MWLRERVLENIKPSRATYLLGIGYFLDSGEDMLIYDEPNLWLGKGKRETMKVWGYLRCSIHYPHVG